MERLKQRLETATKALKSLEKILLVPNTDSDIVRDAAIQRFEYTFETCWKLAQSHLHLHHGLEFNSPKSVIRGCLQSGIITAAETEIALEMADERNLTSHTYNEDLAQEIYSHLHKYHKLMQTLIANIQKNSSL